MFNYDVIVIGAGHAGCEAALAAARMGCRTLLLTISLDTLAWMPCNSSVGGPGRGQLLRELDALGGQMSRIADLHSLHCRRSNTSKGPAVQTPFAIVDRRGYQLEMKYLLEKTENLSLRQALVTDIYPNGSMITVESAFAEVFNAKAVVLAAGTFMRAEVVFGQVCEPAGRYAEIAAPEISKTLEKLGFKLGRHKTGTSPRIAANSINLSAMEVQSPDESPEAISFWSRGFSPGALACYKTHTTQRTKQIIDKNIKSSALFGVPESFVGARYCPSIEDKVVHSPARERHPIFLQPQDREGDELYIQGLSTSLPLEVQIEIVRSVEGLESAQIMRPGYAVMYDFIYPDQLKASLETKLISGLFTAGQINGTTGYEEAAAQGLIAGINAALKVQGKEALVLDRSQAYIGVLIDDLVTKGVDEPYRMFTSRAEYRLLLRSDNADLRLSEIGYGLGLIDDDQYSLVKEKQELIELCLETAPGKRASTKKEALAGDKALAKNKTLAGEKDVAEERSLPGHIARELAAQDLYAGYIAQELRKIEEFRAAEKMRLPVDIDYSRLAGLSSEAVEKLSRVRPESVGQAARIPGLRQTDIQVLHLYGKKFHIKPDQEVRL